MGLSKKQYENLIRTIVVSKVSTELIKAKIVSRIRAAAKNHLDTGGLTYGSRYFTPTSDDQWLVKRESVKISVGSVETGLPSSININVNISFDLNYRYYYLYHKSKKHAWRPNGYAIINWVRRKAQAGKEFLIYDKKSGEWKSEIPATETQVKRVAFMVARKIERKGITKTDIFKPLEGSNGMKAALKRGVNKSLVRIGELYDEQAETALYEALFKVVGD
jgi:hypothetical protein